MGFELRRSAGYQEIVTGIQTLDQEVFEAIADHPDPVLDKVLPALTRAANHSKLWVAIAGAMYATGRPQLRRAAIRGVATVALTSLIANQGAKRLLSRARPGQDSVPLQRRLHRRYPTSSSFPSGHSASAAAFATAVGTVNKPLGLALGGLAGLVGLSRVYTGAHYPGDVLVGFAIGVGIAEAVKRVFPPAAPPKISYTEPEFVASQPRPNGEGVVIVVNPGSDSGHGVRFSELIERELPAAKVVQIAPGEKHAEVIAQAAAEAEVLGIAGGDGTVSTAATVVLASGKPLAVFPAGTFNHFAKTIGCQRPEDTIRALREGRVRKVDVTRWNDDVVILNTFSIGAYPEFVRIREKYQTKIGKPLAAALAFWRTLRDIKTVKIAYDGKTAETALFFLGNSVYLPHGFIPETRPALDDGLVDVRFVDVTKRGAKLRTIWDLARGSLATSPYYHELHVPDFEFTTPDGPTRWAHDGDNMHKASDYKFTAQYRALPVYWPSQD